MARYTGTILTSKPAEEVYDYMADFTSVEDWDETVTEAKRIGNQQPGKGARFSVTFKLAGRGEHLRVRDGRGRAAEPPAAAGRERHGHLAGRDHRPRGRRGDKARL